MKKLGYLDFAKGVCMILIVFGHFFPYGEHPVLIYAYSFHVPAFFIVSGILVEHTKEYEKSLLQLLKTNLLRLIVPYFAFGILHTLLHCGLHGVSNLIWLTKEMISMSSGYATWFLPVLFTAKGYVLLLNKYIGNKLAKGAACLIPFAIALFSGFDDSTGIWELYLFFRTCNAIGFLWIGTMLCRHLERLVHSRRIAFLSFAVSIMTGLQNGRVSAFGMRYGFAPFYVVAAVAGTVFLLYLGNHLKHTKAIAFYSFHSVVVLGTHQDIMEIMRCAFGTETVSIYWYACLIVILLMEIPLAYFINRYAPFFLGKWYKTKLAQERKC